VVDAMGTVPSVGSVGSLPALAGTLEADRRLGWNSPQPQAAIGRLLSIGLTLECILGRVPAPQPLAS
jgi:hypothetical protein